jgi:hypothetical protein
MPERDLPPEFSARLAKRLAKRLDRRLARKLATRLATLPGGSFFDYRAG